MPECLFTSWLWDEILVAIHPWWKWKIRERGPIPGPWPCLSCPPIELLERNILG